MIRFLKDRVCVNDVIVITKDSESIFINDNLNYRINITDTRQFCIVGQGKTRLKAKWKLIKAIIKL
nr:MAG TPA: hypothetical protein [Caudoviricetes sp.]